LSATNASPNNDQVYEQKEASAAYLFNVFVAATHLSPTRQLDNEKTKI
jgi:hypothetical protein